MARPAVARGPAVCGCVCEEGTHVQGVGNHFDRPQPPRVDDVPAARGPWREPDSQPPSQVRPSLSPCPGLVPVRGRGGRHRPHSPRPRPSASCPCSLASNRPCANTSASGGPPRCGRASGRRSLGAVGVGAAGGHLWLALLYERTFRAVLRGGAGGAPRWPRVPAPQSPFWAPLSGLPFRASPEKPPPPPLKHQKHTRALAVSVRHMTKIIPGSKTNQGLGSDASTSAFNGRLDTTRLGSRFPG